MPRPFVPGFRVPAPVSGYGGGPRGNDGGGGCLNRGLRGFSLMPFPYPLALVVLSEPGMGVVTISWLTDSVGRRGLSVE